MINILPKREMINIPTCIAIINEDVGGLERGRMTRG